MSLRLFHSILVSAQVGRFANVPTRVLILSLSEGIHFERPKCSKHSNFSSTLDVPDKFECPKSLQVGFNVHERGDIPQLWNLDGRGLLLVE
jgi:hypothetical protein